MPVDGCRLKNRHLGMTSWKLEQKESSIQLIQSERSVYQVAVAPNQTGLLWLSSLLTQSL